VKVRDTLERISRKIAVRRDNSPEGEQPLRKGFDVIGRSPTSHTNPIVQPLLNKDGLFGLSSQMDSD